MLRNHGKWWGSLSSYVPFYKLNVLRKYVFCVILHISRAKPGDTPENITSCSSDAELSAREMSPCTHGTAEASERGDIPIGPALLCKPVDCRPPDQLIESSPTVVPLDSYKTITCSPLHCIYMHADTATHTQIWFWWGSFPLLPPPICCTPSKDELACVKARFTTCRNRVFHAALRRPSPPSDSYFFPSPPC